MSLAVRQAPGDKCWASMAEAQILVYVTAWDRELIRECLTRLFKKEAGTWLPLRVAKLNAIHFGWDIRQIRIKSQARILGSCSSLGNLNFNWRLMLAPVELIDYVIIHELAHMREMNHSREFWRVVEKACPDYRALRAQLKAINSVLYI